MSFFEELKRRNVFRVGLAYLITGWLLLQVADLVLENIDAPSWIMQVFMLAVAVGFPITLVVAWAFELTPEGLKREKEVDRSASITHVTGRRLDRAIIGVLAVALGYFIWDKAVYRSTVEPAAPVVTQEATEASATQAPARPSIAVLPFANRSSREEDAFFAEGIHDDLLTSLAKVGSLKVISRTSVMRYRDTELPIPDIAAELGVSAVLEGGIQRSGDHVRINVQLIDANSDEHLWAEIYDRELTAETLFTIQSDISREIVTVLRATLTDEESSRLAEQPTDSLEAYGEYVMGRQLMAERTNQSLARAQAHYEKAIELDPEYALAYVGLADALSLQVSYGDLYMLDSYAPRQDALDKALALNPGSGEAYTSLANLRHDQDKDEVAETLFLKAIELSPNYATAWHWYSILLDELDRTEEALEMIDRAIELDPNAPILGMAKGTILWELDRREEAIAFNLLQLEKSPDLPNLYAQRSRFLGSLGRLGESMLWMKAYANLDATASVSAVGVCNMWVQLGDAEEAERCYDAAEEAYPEASFGSRIELHQLRGDFEAALDLSRQIAERYPFDGPRAGLGYNYLSAGQAEAARDLAAEYWPELVGDEPVVIDDTNSWQVGLAGQALWLTGEQERGNYLIDELLAWQESQPPPRVGPIFLHAVRQDTERATAALRMAMDEGWRFGWFRLRYRLFDPLLASPEWVDLVTEMEADIAQQRRWYEENQDQPVL